MWIGHIVEVYIDIVFKHKYVHVKAVIDQWMLMMNKLFKNITIFVFLYNISYEAIITRPLKHICINNITYIMYWEHMIIHSSDPLKFSIILIYENQ